MSILSEFKEFAMKGNVVDLAVGVIIGGAFGKIVDSLVGDIIMPLIAALTGGGLDFHNLFVVLGSIPDGVPRTLDALKKAGVPLFAYGSFITVALNFIILAFVIFQLVKIMNRIKGDEPAPAAPATPEDIILLREIRDNLKK
ncbi:large-conductance mechanosensitive channel [Polynucleobacter sp. SHI8]|uniref:large conductance mechanosensitive channel protein MscL n=1 Tax=unclassified Polynucleobacter TaxID=2640945 RepID=UPI002493134C|nr:MULTISPECIES: large conductance mechanosensitive channel protein MscL [unclassified Polynucleobacter]BDW10053.1 large-conductance mechanosensitive channel [Polynucleobacter sp. SHI2]BDW12499.1 large-conductance mechanosensitive channel [Polynucleobacter sp. SHI8]